MITHKTGKRWLAVWLTFSLLILQLVPVLGVASATAPVDYSTVGSLSANYVITGYSTPQTISATFTNESGLTYSDAFGTAPPAVKVVDASKADVTSSSVTNIAVSNSDKTVSFDVGTGLNEGNYYIRITTIENTIYDAAFAVVTPAISTLSISSLPTTYLSQSITVTGSYTSFNQTTTQISVLNASNTNTNKAGSVNVTNSTSLSFTLSAGLAAGTYTVKAITGNEIVTKTFTVVTPAVTVSPSAWASGYNAVKSVSITGTNTNFSDGTTAVTLLNSDNTANELLVSGLLIISPTSLTVNVPVGLTAGNYKLRVVTGQEQSEVSFVVNTASIELSADGAAFTSINEGYLSAKTITVTGTNAEFSSATTVTLTSGETDFSSFITYSATSNTSNALSFTLGTGLSAGTYTVTTVSNGVTATASFSVVATSVSFSGIQATFTKDFSAAKTVTLTAADAIFSNGVTVVRLLPFSGGSAIANAVSSTTVSSATSLTFVLATGISAGEYKFCTTTNSFEKCTGKITLTAPSATLSTYATSASAAATTPIVVTGTNTNFSAATTVKLIDASNAETTISSPTFTNATSISFTISSSQMAGLYSVRLITTDGGVNETVTVPGLSITNMTVNKSLYEGFGSSATTDKLNNEIIITNNGSTWSSTPSVALKDGGTEVANALKSATLTNSTTLTLSFNSGLLADRSGQTPATKIYTLQIGSDYLSLNVIPMTGISVSSTSDSILSPSGSVTLSVLATYGDSTTQALSTGVTFSSGSLSVATVDATSGVVAAVADGSVTLTASYNLSSSPSTTVTGTKSLTIDISDPAQPVITGVTDGSVNTGNVTPSVTPLAGVTFTYELSKDNVAQSGYAMETLTTNGTYVLTVTATKISNNRTAERSVTFEIDNVTPVAPAIIGVPANSVNPSDATEAITFSAPVGETYTATIAKSGAQGSSSFTSGTSIADIFASFGTGTYTVTVNANRTNNQLTASSNLTFTIVDATQPPAESPSLSVNGTLLSGATAYSTDAAVYWNDINGAIITATISKDSAPEIAYSKGTSVTVNGTYVVTTKACNVLDDSKCTSDVTTTFVIDKDAPTAPSIQNVTNGLNNTFNSGVTPNWTDEPGTTSTVVVKRNNSTITFSKGSSLNSSGTYQITVTATKTNNKLTAITTANFTIDTVGPEFPVVNATANGQSITGLTTGAYALPFLPSWTNPVGVTTTAQVKVGTGSFSAFDPSTATEWTTAGTYTLEITATKSSNALTETRTYTLTLAVQNPAQPALAATTVLAQGRTAYPTDVTINAGSVPNASVVLSYAQDGGTSTTVQGNSLTLATNGVYVFTAVATSTLDNSKTSQSTLTVIVDKNKPDAPIIANINQNAVMTAAVTPSVTTVSGVTYAYALTKNTVLVNGYSGGAISGDGNYLLTITGTKSNNGLTETTVRSFQIDTVTPAAPIVSNILDGDVFANSILPSVTTVNGVTFTFELTKDNVAVSGYNGGEISGDGLYALTVTTVRTNNGLSTTGSTLNFEIDSTGPTGVSVNNPEDGYTYLSPVAVDLTYNPSEVDVTYVLTRNNVTVSGYSGGDISSAGTYVLNVTFKKVKNDVTSTIGPISFTIDGDNPNDPAINKLSDTYRNDQLITITADAGTWTYYTLDGTNPSAEWNHQTNSLLVNGTKYSDSFTIGGVDQETTTIELKVISYDLIGSPSSIQKPGLSSQMVSRTFTFDKVGPAVPVASVSGGTFNTNQSVSLSLATDASVTYTTLDGSVPSAMNGDWYTSGATIQITGDHEETVVLKAISYDELGNAGPVMTETYVFDKQGPTAPLASVAAGTFNQAQSVTLTVAGDVTGTFYTVNGTEPTNNNTAYVDAISIDAANESAITLKAVSYDATGNKGDVLTVVYTFDKQGPAAPTASLLQGTYNSAKSVTLTTAEQGATTYYTLDGTEPSNSSATYEDAITVDANDGQSKTIKAVSYDSLGNKGIVLTVVYTFDKQAPAAPTASVAQGTYNTAKSVTLTAAEQGVTTYYTLDGNEPTNSSTVYNGSVSIDATHGQSKTLQAVSYDAVGNKGVVMTVVYTFDKQGPAAPTASVVQGTYNTAKSVAISAAEQDVTTYYTLDGTEPTNSSSTYVDEINVDANHGLNKTLKAVSYDAAGNKGSLLTVIYSFDKQGPASPTASVAQGTYNTAKSVTITASEQGVTTHYTLDGTEPNANSNAYMDAISIDAADGIVKTLKVVSIDVIGNKGAILTVVYTFDKQAPAAPTANPGTGTYSSARSVSLTIAADAASTYYTLNGSEPTKSSIAYNGNILVDGNDGQTVVLKSISYDAAGNASGITTTSYTFSKPVPPPPPVVTPSPSPTPEPTPEITATPSVTNTPTPSPTPIVTSTPTPLITSSPTPTGTPSVTPKATPTVTATVSPKATPEPTLNPADARVAAEIQNQINEVNKDVTNANEAADAVSKIADVISKQLVANGGTNTSDALQNKVSNLLVSSLEETAKQISSSTTEANAAEVVSKLDDVTQSVSDTLEKMDNKDAQNKVVESLTNLIESSTEQLFDSVKDETTALKAAESVTDVIGTLAQTSSVAQDEKAKEKIAETVVNVFDQIGDLLKNNAKSSEASLNALDIVNDTIAESLNLVKGDASDEQKEKIVEAVNGLAKDSKAVLDNITDPQKAIEKVTNIVEQIGSAVNAAGNTDNKSNVEQNIGQLVSSVVEKASKIELPQESVKTENNQVTLSIPLDLLMTSVNKANDAKATMEQSLNKSNLSIEIKPEITIQIPGNPNAEDVKASVPAEAIGKLKESGITSFNVVMGNGTKISVDVQAQEKALYELAKQNGTFVLADTGLELISDAQQDGSYNIDLRYNQKQIKAYYKAKALRIELDGVPAKVSDAEKVAVFKKSGNTWKAVGGTLNAAKGTVSTYITEPGVYKVMESSKQFADTSKLGAWAKRPIEVLTAKGVVSDQTDKFNPNDSVTKAQYVKMLIEALNLNDKKAVTALSDVAPGKWYYSYIATAEDLGMISGNKGKFNPDAKITRQEMAKMTASAAEAVFKLKTTKTNELVGKLKDGGSIAAFAKEAVALLQQYGVVTGNNAGKFNPKSLLTRAEATAIIYRVYNLKS